MSRGDVHACAFSRMDVDIHVTCPAGNKAVAGALVPRGIREKYDIETLYGTISTDCGTILRAPKEEVKGFIEQYQDDFSLVTTTSLEVMPYIHGMEQEFDVHNRDLLACRTHEYQIFDGWIFFYEHKSDYCYMNSITAGSCTGPFQAEVLPFIIFLFQNPGVERWTYLLAILMGMATVAGFILKFDSKRNVVKGFIGIWVIIWLLPPFSTVSLGILGGFRIVRSLWHITSQLLGDYERKSRQLT